jgi:hypothetical protein
MENVNIVKRGGKVSRYRVFTKQVDQDIYHIDAETEEEAIKKAKEEWSKDWGCEILCVEKGGAEK